MFVTTMRTARILGWGREPRTTEFAPPPRGAFLLRIDWVGCIIVTSGLPDPDQLFAHPYICMPDVPRSLPNENLRAAVPRKNSVQIRRLVGPRDKPSAQPLYRSLS